MQIEMYWFTVSTRHCLLYFLFLFKYCTFHSRKHFFIVGMGLKTKKGTKGEAVQYYSRKSALRHLQISLPNFERLCSWRGIYPTQPRSLKKAGKGNTEPRIYYRRKDINILLHEPILEMLRLVRAHNLKIKKARERKDKARLFTLQQFKPRILFNDIIPKLYPSVEDTISNMSDALRTVFLFATLPKLPVCRDSLINRCWNVKMAFLNYCISQKAVRKLFIMAYGYQVEVIVRGIPVVFAMPHQNTVANLPARSDYRMLSNQCQFDVVLLIGLLKKLFLDSGLKFPPQFTVPQREDGWSLTFRQQMDSMAYPLSRASGDNIATNDDDPRSSLFSGKKVFLNREIPREIFSFVVRCCGGNVSWDDSICSGAPFAESENDIDLHVIDRPVDRPIVSRSYVIPQYIADSLNAGRLLPFRDYMPGCTIPHLSPFVDHTDGGYIPPEHAYLRGDITVDELHKVEDQSDCDEEPPEEKIEECDSEDDIGEYESDEFDSEHDEMDVDEDEKNKTSQIQKSVIEKKVVKDKNKKNQKLPASKRVSKEEMDRVTAANKQRKNLEALIPKRRRNVYNKIKHSEKQEKKKNETLKQKRKQYNKKVNKTKK